jgi:assimilatory nitrate reductase catalytic subunit
MTFAADATPDWDHLKSLFDAPALDDIERRNLLSGRIGDRATDTGALLCACFGVGINTIRAAIASRTASSIEEIGKALRAGTNCGSCIPEMKKLLAQTKPEGKSHDHLAHTA